MRTQGAVLALELSTPRGSVAVVAADGLRYEAEFESERSHNACLFAPLQEALEAAGEELALVLVGTGPGSYTGVRIAIAAAQGVGLAREVPVAGMSSLLGSLPLEDDAAGVAVVIGDARRGQLYRADLENGGVVEPIRLFPRADWEAEQAALPVGAEMWSCDGKPPLPGWEDRLRVPRARWLAQRALAMGVGAYADDPELEPWYLQEAFITQATRNRF
ncbi:MAG: tRNA (adenosine(37)-N6)-threonylcarbamoyltransferase complex dimerization subunit type 1 TsaB [Verrucomicrobiales bacterium]|nr:tRNA (adenosine(37)-N6)-threonylcarbamoyltransferase complex dimerization subunit type 1 TsaB [Verrucomicrobiales bacterium]